MDKYYKHYERLKQQYTVT